MRKVLVAIGIVAITTLGLQSCKKNAKDAKQTTGAKEEVKASEGAEYYSVNVANSKIEWEGGSIVSRHSGYILFKSGEITLKDGKLETGNFSIDMNSLKSEDIEDAVMREKLDSHLKEKDFFEVSKYPEAKFTITSVKALEGKYNAELEGNLELKGIKKICL